MRKPIACILALLCLAACAHEATPREPETTYIKVFSQEDAGIFAGPSAAANFPQLWDDSNHVVHATVSAIGEAYLYDGSTISPSDSEKVIIHKMTKIHTPLTLTIIETFKGGFSSGDELILTEFWGEMNGYLMNTNSRYTRPELGGEYIFFIDRNDNLPSGVIGEAYNIAWTQGSVRINTDSTPDFEPLLSISSLYEPYTGSDEIIAAIRALGEAS